MPLSVAILFVPHTLTNPQLPEFWKKMVMIYNFFLCIYPHSTEVLSLSLTLMVSGLLNILTKRVERKANQVNMVNERMLDDWKRQYYLIDCFVEELNRSFGLNLAIMVTSTFVRVINQLFKMMVSYSTNEKMGLQEYALVHFTLIDFLGFMLHAYVSHRIGQQVVISLPSHMHFRLVISRI